MLRGKRHTRKFSLCSNYLANWHNPPLCFISEDESFKSWWCGKRMLFSSCTKMDAGNVKLNEFWKMEMQESQSRKLKWLKQFISPENLCCPQLSQGKYCSKGTIWHGVKCRICINTTLHNAVFLSRKDIAFAATYQSIVLPKIFKKKRSYHHYLQSQGKRWLQIFEYL